MSRAADAGSPDRLSDGCARRRQDAGLPEARYGLAVVVVNPLVVTQMKDRLAGAEVEEVEAGEVAPAALQERLVRLALDSRLEHGA
jgi:hypothetical protein